MPGDSDCRRRGLRRNGNALRTAASRHIHDRSRGNRIWNREDVGSLHAIFPLRSHGYSLRLDKRPWLFDSTDGRIAGRSVRTQDHLDLHDIPRPPFALRPLSLLPRLMGGHVHRAHRLLHHLLPRLEEQDIEEGHHSQGGSQLIRSPHPRMGRQITSTQDTVYRQGQSRSSSSSGAPRQA